MLIDWFTVVAQIINFLVLVALLKIFLFDPILGRVDARRQEMLDKEKAAKKTLEDSKEKKKNYEKKLNEVEKEKEEILKKAKSDAEEKQKQLFEDAKTEMEKEKVNWKKEINREKKKQIEAIKKQMESAIFSVTRNILKEFSDTDLQEKMLESFVKQLDSVEGKKNESDLKKIAIISTFPISDAWKKKLENKIQSRFGDVALDYKWDEALLGGLVLEADSYRLMWNPKHYLDEVEQQIK